MMEMLTRPLAVVAHDAGAANHIFAWLGDEEPILCLAGPALKMWQAHLKKKPIGPVPEFGIPLHRDFSQSLLLETDLVVALAGAATVITGTGWESSLEFDARKLAREQGIYSIAVIDHWLNYADRFIRNGEQVLPDEIWVSDLYAAKIAQSAFPSVRVVQQTNEYQAELVAEVESRQPLSEAQGNDRVLYVLEPIRQEWGELTDLGEFMALDYFMTNRHRTPISVNAEIRLRPHPSDRPGKYDAWLARQSTPRVSLDQSATLADALAWSNVVVGCQTYAMVLALACGRVVVSAIPPWAPPCVLPHEGIIKMAKENSSEFFKYYEQKPV
jgi:hypothetical protein